MALETTTREGFLARLYPLVGPHNRACFDLSDSFSETVRKGILRQRLGRVPSMRRAYQTDLSDAEWSYLEPHIPTPKAPGRPRVRPLRERVRVRMGRMDRDPQPSAGVVVSQSVKTTGVGGEGIRWRQEGKGHSKRHLLVDTQGLV